MTNCIRLLFLCLLTLVASGCGDGMATITGEVKQDGELVQQGVIHFAPVDGIGPTAEVVIQNGKYEVRTTPGKKKVSVTAMKKVGEYKVPGSDGPPIPQHEETKHSEEFEVTSDGAHDISFTSK